MTRSGPTSYGYRREGERLVMDAIEAPIRLRIFELFLIHQRKKTVADILNSENFKTRNGSYFSGQTVGRLLKEKIVIGEKGKIDQIVPKDLFEKCEKILISQNQKGGASRRPNHLFAGIAYCGCGGKMYVPTASRKYVCRDCKSKIAKRDIETIFVESVISKLEKEKPKSKILKAFKEWPILSLRSKIGLTQTTALRVDINNNKITITLFNI